MHELIALKNFKGAATQNCQYCPPHRSPGSHGFLEDIRSSIERTKKPAGPQKPTRRSGSRYGGRWAPKIARWFEKMSLFY